MGLNASGVIDRSSINANSMGLSGRGALGASRMLEVFFCLPFIAQMKTSFASGGLLTGVCPWFGLRGNDCDDSHLVGVLR